MLNNHLIGAAITNMTTATTGAVLFAMTDALIVNISGALVLLVTNVVTIYFAYKSKTNSAEAKTISTETGKAVNGKMEEFKKMAEEFYHAKGVADEKVAAEAKAGVEAIAKAKGKAEATAVTLPPPPPNALN